MLNLPSTPTTPDIITDELKEIMKFVSSETPFYPVFISIPHMEAGSCHNNVRMCMQAVGGGEQVYGWLVCVTNKHVEFEFHSLWKAPNGDVVDVTPRDESKILFLPDPTRHYRDGDMRTYNVRVCEWAPRRWYFWSNGKETTEERSSTLWK